LTKKGWEKFKIIQKGEKFVSKFRSKGRGTGEGGIFGAVQIRETALAGEDDRANRLIRVIPAKPFASMQPNDDPHSTELHPCNKKS